MLSADVIALIYFTECQSDSEPHSLHLSPYPNPLPFHIVSEPSPVIGLITKALGPCGHVLGNVGGKSFVKNLDGHPLLEGLDVGD